MEQVLGTKLCKLCSVKFDVTDKDRAFYEKISPEIGGKKILIPDPTLCPDCRQQRRLAQGNQLHLYKRKCDKTGAEVISNYHPDGPYTVYAEEVWWGNDWDATEYGRDFDFSRPFFEQFQELSLAVPRPALQRGFQYDENSDYTNYAGKNKNCYLIFDSDECRDCYYAYSVNSGEDVMDCYRIRSGQLNFECVDCVNCYNSYFLQDCQNCTDSYFLKNCIGCKNCIMCSNLRNKEYYINNQPVSKEEFEKYKEGMKSRAYIKQMREHFEKFKLQFPEKYMHGVQNENVTGDYLTSCKDSSFCFDGANLWDCKYSYQSFNPLKNVMDTQECGDAELLYECAFVGYGTYDVKFSIHALADGTTDLMYCNYSPHSQHCFGSIGVKHKKYCILNKQYTQEEYEALVPRIIEHMKTTGEWGEFFPMSLSSFGYNETLAQEHYPLTKEEALGMGLKWQDEDEKNYAPSQYVAPDTIAEVSDDVLKEVLACTTCGRNYRIMKQELELLKKFQMPLPEECFFCRHDKRREMRNPKKMYDRKCMKCGVDIKTTYAEGRPEIVYCEKCYLESVD